MERERGQKSRQVPRVLKFGRYCVFNVVCVCVNIRLKHAECTSVATAPVKTPMNSVCKS